MAVPSPKAVIEFMWRSSKRIAVTVVGLVLLAAGLAMMVLPGPGIVVILLGLAVLATEYVWAAVLLEKAKATAAKGGNIAKDTFKAAKKKVGR